MSLVRIADESRISNSGEVEEKEERNIYDSIPLNGGFGSNIKQFDSLIDVENPIKADNLRDYKVTDYVLSDDLATQRLDGLNVPDYPEPELISDPVQNVDINSVQETRDQNFSQTKAGLNGFIKPVLLFSGFFLLIQSLKVN